MGERILRRSDKMGGFALRMWRREAERNITKGR